MYFVTTIYLDTDKTDYKVFEKYEDARMRFYAAWGYALDGKPIKTKSGENVFVEAVRLYRVNAQAVEVAKEIVESGRGELLEDSENPLFPDLDLNI